MKISWVALILLIALPGAMVIAMPSFAQSGRAAADLAVYTDALATGWQDWSWNTTINRSNTTPVHSGIASIAASYAAAWGGVYLHADSVDISAYDTLRFWLHGGSAGGQRISVSLNFGSTREVIATAGTWQKIEIPLSDLGSPTTITDLVWQDGTGGAQPTFYLDDIAFVSTGAPTPIPPPAASGPALSVNAAADQHPISPYIYGINFASEAVANALRLPVRRWGGNSTSRYNWQLDVHNTGGDWYFENIPDGQGTVDQFVEQDRRTGTQTLLTMPLIGWTPKARKDNHPYDCGFGVKYGAQDSVDPWDTNCGNGEHNSNPITGNDPHDTSVEITTTFVISWINHLTSKYGTAANGGVTFYNLDNEPMLWNSTHRDVHPTPTTYDEVRDRTWAYAAAIKAADPTAKTLGPVVWGWCAYFYSAADGCSSGTDRQTHGNTDFVEWYLQQMHTYEQQNGVRILDDVDVHYYPQASGVSLSPAGSSAVQALRLRSTRSLWDPSYTDESWIGQPVYLIPRMKQWVTSNYTGTKLAITEYNWGALDHINGALAQADVLGIFGREGLDLAMLWGPPDTANTPGILAFRMYRNYDGLGGAFGETSVRATSADQSKLAIYAAQRSQDGALTLMAINKTSQTLTSTLTLTNFQPAAFAQVYRYSAANLAAVVHELDQVVTINGFMAVLPANSITLFILPSGVPLTPRVYLPLVLR